MNYLAYAVTVLSYVLYPIFLLLNVIVTILVFLTAPIIHLAHYAVYACAWPFQFLARFETLYVFFGIATVIGVLTGTSLHFASGFMASILNIESRPVETRRDLAEYRVAWRRKEEKARSPALPEVGTHQPKIGGGLKDEYDEWLKQDKIDQKKRGLIPSTILEEDDSSDNDF